MTWRLKSPSLLLPHAKIPEFLNGFDHISAVAQSLRQPVKPLHCGMTEQHELFRQGALNAWYEAAKPALFTNKTIREWLGVYSESQRPDVVKVVLLYGILCLQNSFGPKTLTLQELKATTEQAHSAVTLSKGLPALKEDVAHIQQALRSFEDKVVTAQTVES